MFALSCQLMKHWVCKWIRCNLNLVIYEFQSDPIRQSYKSESTKCWIKFGYIRTNSDEIRSELIIFVWKLSIEISRQMLLKKVFRPWKFSLRVCLFLLGVYHIRYPISGFGSGLPFNGFAEVKFGAYLDYFVINGFVEVGFGLFCNQIRSGPNPVHWYPTWKRKITIGKKTRLAFRTPQIGILNAKTQS